MSMNKTEKEKLLRDVLKESLKVRESTEKIYELDNKATESRIKIEKYINTLDRNIREERLIAGILEEISKYIHDTSLSYKSGATSIILDSLDMNQDEFIEAVTKIYNDLNLEKYGIEYDLLESKIQRPGTTVEADIIYNHNTIEMIKKEFEK